MVLIKTLKILPYVNTKDKQIEKTLKNLTAVKKVSKLQTKPKKSQVLENSINYVLNITFSSTNTLINLSNIKGQTLIFLSSGYINLKKKTKKNSTYRSNKFTKNINFESLFFA